MNSFITSQALDDIDYFKKNNKKLVKKILVIIKDIEKHPYEGIGRPEPLKHELSGYWSRRLDKEHRIIYKINGDLIEIIQCRYHYTK